MRMKFRIPVTLVICGIVLLVLGVKGLLTIFIFPTNWITDEDCDWTKLKSGQSVSADFYCLYGPACLYGDDKEDTSAIYVIPDEKPVEGKEGYYENAHFMGIIVNKSEFSKYDSLVGIEDYSNFTENDFVPFDGYLRKMKNEEQKYFVEFLKENGLSDEEINQKFIPLVAVKRQTPIAYLGMCGIGVLCLAGGAVIGIFAFRKQ